MGEKIADIGMLPIAGKEFTVELNHGAIAGGPRDVHLQNHLGRMHLSEREFYMLLAKMVYSSKRMQLLKGHNEE